ncbi:hypothetical protein [Nannocystis pusilla]|uniref:hypothetical protein n=1 Tax=Nannocystis pusilla TaxID=889268 RepID=UPI003DA36AA9
MALKSGISALHGPHQVAHRLTTWTACDGSTSCAPKRTSTAGLVVSRIASSLTSMAGEIWVPNLPT